MLRKERRITMKTIILFLIVISFIAFSVANADVEYQHKDTKTQGDWKGKYGSAGGVLFDNGGSDNTNINGKKGDQLVKGVLTEYDDAARPRWNWASHTDDQRGLQYVKEEDRIGACIWGSGTSTLTLTVDSKDYQVAAYFIDWDSNVRVQEIVGYQKTAPAKADALLQGAEFHDGVWHLWHVTDTEPFKLNIAHQGGANWVISAFLIDTAAFVAPQGKLTTTWGRVKSK
jgi:hypothetical protein